MPRTSVIMPCFNHGRFVAESARSILGQTDTDLELIIVDDCSTDDSASIIAQIADADARVRFIRQPRNGGASRARNAGLRAAQGEFIAFCDADDRWDRDKLEIQLLLLGRHPEHGLVYCDAMIVDEQGVPTGLRFSDYYQPPSQPTGNLFRELISRNFINIQTVLLRRSCLRTAPGFDEQIRWVEDWLLWILLSRAHTFLYLPLALGSYRVHSGSTNRTQARGAVKNRIKAFIRVLRQFPDVTPAIRAELLRNVGAELCELGRYRAGHSLLWRACRLSLSDVRGLAVGWKSLRRAVVPENFRAAFAAPIQKYHGG